jgi:uncharacterized membrane protein
VGQSKVRAIISGTALVKEGSDMLKRILICGAAAFAIVALTHAPARAAFTVCNNTTYGPLMVATAYEYDNGSDAWSRSEGFYYLGQGDCTNTLTDLTGNEQLYIFAWAANDQSVMWDGGSNYSTGAKEFCVDGNSGSFVYRADDAEPPCNTGVVRTFRHAGTADDSGAYTYNLSN